MGHVQVVKCVWCTSNKVLQQTVASKQRKTSGSCFCFFLLCFTGCWGITEQPLGQEAFAIHHLEPFQAGILILSESCEFSRLRSITCSHIRKRIWYSLEKKRTILSCYIFIFCNLARFIIGFFVLIINVGTMSVKRTLPCWLKHFPRQE